MMQQSDPQPGDIFTFPIRGDACGIGRVIVVTDLALSDYVHVEILDAVIEAGPGGLDAQGDPLLRTHDLPDLESLARAVDHVALRREAFDASSPMIVGFREVADDELVGYDLWRRLYSQQLVRMGLLSREAIEERNDDEFEDEGEEEVDEERADLPVEGAEMEEGDGARSEPVEEGEESTENAQVIVAKPWHHSLYTAPLGSTLVELRHELESLGNRLSAFVAGLYSADGGAIDELVERLRGGDFAAGHELMEYGDAAVAPLAAELTLEADPQLVEDVLNVLADLGSEQGYEAIGSFFETTLPEITSPVAERGARAFCYTVMLTGGTPEPLRSRLHLLERLSTIPTFAEDIASARSAVETAAGSA